MPSQDTVLEARFYAQAASSTCPTLLPLQRNVTHQWKHVSNKHAPGGPWQPYLRSVPLQFGRFFKVQQRKSSLLNELRAGTVTFLTVSSGPCTCSFCQASICPWLSAVRPPLSLTQYVPCRLPTYCQSTPILSLRRVAPAHQMTAR